MRAFATLLLVGGAVASFSRRLQSTTSAQREALVALYVATNGRQWSSAVNWTVGDPCMSRWQGVSCTNGNITALCVPTVPVLWPRRTDACFPPSQGSVP
eukprot:504131-Prymnesium_polylepis.1